MAVENRYRVFWRGDPLMSFFRGRLKLSDLQVVLLFVVFAAAVELGLAALAQYLNRPQEFDLTFTDPRYINLALLHVFIFAPIMVGFYVWQPKAFAELLYRFGKTDAIRRVSETGEQYVKSYPDYLLKCQSEWDNKRWAIMAVVVAAVIQSINLLFAWPAETSVIGTAFWYETKWFLAVFTLELLVFSYVFGMIIFNLVRTILCLRNLFNWFDVTIRPLDPDEAGGMGGVGRFVLQIGLYSIGFGAMAALYTMYFVLVGVSLLDQKAVFLLWALYLLIVPISLVLLMLSPHTAMKRARDEELGQIATKFERILNGSAPGTTDDAGKLKAAHEELLLLKTRYEIVVETFPTWPMSAKIFRNYSIAGSLPLAIGLLSLGFQYLGLTTR